MDFDDTYDRTYHLVLNSGRTIFLEKLIQQQTYSGLILGTPNKELNDQKIAQFIDEARELTCSKETPFLVPPERKGFRDKPGDMAHSTEWLKKVAPKLNHVPEWLPEVQCIGLFESLRPARDMDTDGSSLTIVWYQRDFGIDVEIMEKIRIIDWDQHAKDFMM